MYVADSLEVMGSAACRFPPQPAGFQEQQAVEAGEEDANIAIYADESVTYGQLVEVLNAGP